MPTQHKGSAILICGNCMTWYNINVVYINVSQKEIHRCQHFNQTLAILFSTSCKDAVFLEIVTPCINSHASL